MSCPVCLSELTHAKVTLKCKHELCVTCFTSWARRNNTCPCCRDQFAEPPEKPAEKRITPPIAQGIVSRHNQELKDYAVIKMMEMKKAASDNERAHIIKEIINYNINIMASRMVVFYEN